MGKTTGEEREVISAFMEDEPGEREKRLRDEVERDVGMLEEWDEEESLIAMAVRPSYIRTTPEPSSFARGFALGESTEDDLVPC